MHLNQQPNRGYDRRMRSSLTLAATALAGALASAGCMWIPYDHAVVVKPAAAESRLELAGGAEDALLQAEALRLDYFNKLQRTSLFREATASLAIGLTGWGLYNALKPTSDPVYIGDRRRTVRLASGVAALYAGRQTFVNVDHEKAWAQGYRALTCMMFQASPLLMTQTKRNPGTTAPAALDATDANKGVGDVERLQDQMRALNDQVLLVHSLVALYDAQVDALIGTDPEMKVAGEFFLSRSRNTRTALEYAKTAWRDAGTLLDTVGQAGYRIRAEVGLIVAINNETIQAKQLALLESAQLFKQGNEAAVGLAAIKSIGVETEADQADLKVTRPADAQAAAGGSSLAAYSIRPVAWRVDDAATGSQPGVPLVAPFQAVAPLAPQVVQTTPPAVVKPAIKKAPGPKAPAKGPADRVATAASLKEIRDRIDKAITKIESDDQTAKDKKTNDALDLKRAKYKAQLYSTAREKLSCRGPTWKGDVCLENLLLQTEVLYALRRPVAAKVIDFRDRARQISDAPECVDLSQLHVSPGGPIRVEAGSTLEFIISQRLGDVSPQAVLQGPTQDESGAKLSLASIPSTTLTKMTLVLGVKMESQRLRVIVSDAHRATQVVTVTVVKKPEKKVVASDASSKDAPKAATSS